MTPSDPLFIALTYLAGFVFPFVAAGCGIVALWSLTGFVRGIFNDLRGDGPVS
jgi:hypothetical protein